MHYKDQNEAVGWKQRLEELQYLPGESLDKNAAWEKLQSRLQDEPRTIKAAWYWLAAACFVAVVVAGVIFFNAPRAGIAERVISADKSNKRAETNETAEQGLATGPVVKKENITTGRNPTKVPVHIKEQVAVSGDTSATALPVNITVVPLLNNDVSPVAAQLPDSTPAIAVIVPKKQLKVVHVNELGNPPVDEITLARSRDLIFPGNILSKHTVAYSEFFSKEPSRNLLSIKLNSPK